MSAKLFQRLDPSTQISVLAVSPWTEEEARQTAPSDAHLALVVCRNGLLSALEALLDAGMDPSFLPGDPSHALPGIAPLAHLNPVRSSALVMQALLLRKGADPNFLAGTHRGQNLVSPMHEAVKSAPMLQQLVDHGGNVNLRDPNGWSVMDHWMRHGREFIHTAQDILPALEVLVGGGWDPLARLYKQRATLPRCWDHANLRDCLPRLLELGFDPLQRDMKLGEPSEHLLDRATMVPPDSALFALAQRVQAHANGRLLEGAVASASASAPRSTPRL